MSTLLRNSLLAQSESVNSSTSDDLSKAIPPPLPFLPQTLPSQIPKTAFAIKKSPSPATYGEFNKLYKQLQSDAGRDLIGNDPFLQKNAIEKIEQDYIKKIAEANVELEKKKICKHSLLPVPENLHNCILNQATYEFAS